MRCQQGSTGGELVTGFKTKEDVMGFPTRYVPKQGAVFNTSLY